MLSYATAQFSMCVGTTLENAEALSNSESEGPLCDLTLGSDPRALIPLMIAPECGAVAVFFFCFALFCLFVCVCVCLFLFCSCFVGCCFCCCRCCMAAVVVVVVVVAVVVVAVVAVVAVAVVVAHTP